MDIYNTCDIQLYYTDNKINEVNDIKYVKDKNKMSRSNKIENLVNRYIERHIKEFMDLSSLPKQGIKYGDLLPTPVASDHTGSCTIRKMTKSNGAPRTDSLRNMPAVIGMDGDRLNGRVFQLSPLFVEEMMGYPLMWTTLPFLTGNGEKNQ